MRRVIASMIQVAFLMLMNRIDCLTINGGFRFMRANPHYLSNGDQSLHRERAHASQLKLFPKRNFWEDAANNLMHAFADVKDLATESKKEPTENQDSENDILDFVANIADLVSDVEIELNAECNDDDAKNILDRNESSGCATTVEERLSVEDFVSNVDDLLADVNAVLENSELNKDVEPSDNVNISIPMKKKINTDIIHRRLLETRLKMEAKERMRKVGMNGNKIPIKLLTAAEDQGVLDMALRKLPLKKSDNKPIQNIETKSLNKSKNEGAKVENEWVDQNRNISHPVDEEISIHYEMHPSTSFHVCKNEENGFFYDVVLNECNITGSTNVNKYYTIQMLKKSSTIGEHFVWTKWGRVGYASTGRRLVGPLVKEKALQMFTDKFYDKSGNDFGSPMLFHLDGKYKVMEIDYSEVDWDSEAIASTNVGLNQRRLSKEQIEDGIYILHQIEQKLSNMTAYPESFSELSSQFFTTIPHSFGIYRAPIIRNRKLLELCYQNCDVLLETAERSSEKSVSVKTKKNLTSKNNNFTESFKSNLADLASNEKKPQHDDATQNGSNADEINIAEKRMNDEVVERKESNIESQRSLMDEVRAREELKADTIAQPVIKRNHGGKGKEKDVVTLSNDEKEIKNEGLNVTSDTVMKATQNGSNADEINIAEKRMNNKVVERVEREESNIESQRSLIDEVRAREELKADTNDQPVIKRVHGDKTKDNDVVTLSNDEKEIKNEGLNVTSDTVMKNNLQKNSGQSIPEYPILEEIDLEDTSEENKLKEKATTLSVHELAKDYEIRKVLGNRTRTGEDDRRLRLKTIQREIETAVFNSKGIRRENNSDAKPVFDEGESNELRPTPKTPMNTRDNLDMKRSVQPVETQNTSLETSTQSQVLAQRDQGEFARRLEAAAYHQEKQRKEANEEKYSRQEERATWYKKQIELDMARVREYAAQKDEDKKRFLDTLSQKKKSPSVLREYEAERLKKPMKTETSRETVAYEHTVSSVAKNEIAETKAMIPSSFLSPSSVEMEDSIERQSKVKRPFRIAERDFYEKKAAEKTVSSLLRSRSVISSAVFIVVLKRLFSIFLG